MLVQGRKAPGVEDLELNALDLGKVYVYLLGGLQGLRNYTYNL